MAENHETDAQILTALVRIAAALESIDGRLASVIGARQEPTQPHIKWNVVQTEDRSRK